MLTALAQAFVLQKPPAVQEAEAKLVRGDVWAWCAGGRARGGQVKHTSHPSIRFLFSLPTHPQKEEGEGATAAYEGPLAKEVKILMADNSGRQAKFEAAEVVVKQVGGWLGGWL